MKRENKIESTVNDLDNQPSTEVCFVAIGSPGRAKRMT